MAKRPPPRAPLLEWLAAAFGLALVLAVAAVIARDAINVSAETAPGLVVRATAIRPEPDGFLLEFEARNLTPVTAAAVAVEAALPGGETSAVTLDYVPGNSARRGGLLFRNDPRGAALRVRGYQDP